MLRWFPAMLWMAVIFTASGDAGSFRRSSRIVEPMLKFFWPSITPAQIHTTVVVVRKSAHVIEYAVLALLLL
jgi:VanZ family protein